jgi:hypothetical protein
MSDRLTDPCHNPDFCKQCRIADRAVKRHNDQNDPKLELLRQLLDDEISLERTYHVVALKTQEAPAATVEGLMFSLRSGVDALRNPSTLSRLARLSESQARDVAERVRKFKPNIAPAWELDAVEALLRIWSLRHGR